MSLTTTTTTTLSGHLLMGTGIVHCIFGLLVPELRQPLVRIAREWAVIPRNHSTNDNNNNNDSNVISDHYERECAFWFQFGGVMMISQGYLLRQYCLETSQCPPRWFGWYLTLLGLFGVSVMPASGFSLVLCQGVWLLLSSSPIGNSGNGNGNGDPSSPQQQQQKQRAK
jgi:Family of unknown function (DUF6463)